ncbi:MAG: cupin domain-containing protein [Gemmatimonadetes bacterium]|nr:cupin domain-containing protein [Gemmatimonadota bacterium]
MSWTNTSRITRLGSGALVGTLGAALLLTACEQADRTVAPRPPQSPQLTMGSGVTPIDFGPGGSLARGTFAVKVREVNRHGSPLERWKLETGTHPNVDVAVRSFQYAPGSYTGWHRHPGPVFIQVLEGTVTFYESDDPDCTPIVVSAGQAYLDTGEHAHIGRNETDQPARDLVVLFAPAGEAFRIDAPDPGHCPF